MPSTDAAPPPPGIGRLKTTCEWVLAALCVALPVTLSLRRSLAVDEYIYLHWAYEASRGAFAGADYFATHLPFMQVLLAPAFWIERSTPERGAVVARVAFALLGVASVCLAFRSYDRANGITGTGVAHRHVPSVAIAAIAVGACDSYANRAVEVRPDNVYVFFLLLSVASIPRSRHRARAWLSGACFGWAVLSSEKIVIAIASLFAAHAAALLVSSRARVVARDTAVRANARDFALGFLVSSAVGILLSTGGNLRGGMEQMRELATYLRGRFAERRPFMENPGAEGFLTVVGLSAASIAIISFVGLVARTAREPENTRRRFVWPPTYLGLLAGGVLTYAVQRESYEYSRVLLFIVAVPLLADAMATIVSALRLPKVAAAGAQLATLGALANHGIAGVDWPQQQPTLDANLAMLADVRAATTSEDCVYDNSSGAYFRDHVHPYYVMTDHLMRDTQGAKIAAEVPPLILSRGCVAMMVDYRNGFSQPLQRFLDSHFVQVSPYFYFYGTKLTTRVLADPADFIAPRGSWYLADPPGATVRLSSEDPWSERVWLDRGSHKVFASQKDTRLIWQPRDGSPKPAYRGRTDLRFSHI